MLSNSETIASQLLERRRLQAEHRRIRDCDVEAYYLNKAGRIVYRMNTGTVTVRCARGIDALLAAMATVADWHEWQDVHTL